MSKSTTVWPSNLTHHPGWDLAGMNMLEGWGTVRGISVVSVCENCPFTNELPTYQKWRCSMAVLDCQRKHLKDKLVNHDKQSYSKKAGQAGNGNSPDSWPGEVSIQACLWGWRHLQTQNSCSCWHDVGHDLGDCPHILWDCLHLDKVTSRIWPCRFPALRCDQEADGPRRAHRMATTSSNFVWDAKAKAGFQIWCQSFQSWWHSWLM